MRKLKSTIPNGGAPLLEFPVLRTMFDDETKNAIEALLKSVADGETQGFILSGCAVTGTSGNFAISSGYIYVDGEVLFYSGGSAFSATRYLKKATVTEEGGVFADSVSRDYITVNEATDFGTTGGGSGTQYVTVSHASGGRTLADRMGDFINDGKVTAAKIASGAVTDVKLAEARVKSVGTQLLTKTVEIGDWDMDTDATVNVPHGLANFEKIRSVSAIIRRDSITNAIYDIYKSVEGQADSGGIDAINSINVVLRRKDNLFFDSIDFNSTSFNRGWVTIIYEA